MTVDILMPTCKLLENNTYILYTNGVNPKENHCNEFITIYVVIPIQLGTLLTRLITKDHPVSASTR